MNGLKFNVGVGRYDGNMSFKSHDGNKWYEDALPFRLEDCVAP
jgi:hypothetical protein